MPASTFTPISPADAQGIPPRHVPACGGGLLDDLGKSRVVRKSLKEL